jgi:hypothetical protein
VPPGMLTQFPKLTPQIYEHALLVHVPALLSTGSLLDGSPWFLEVFDKVWENHLLHHNNTGGCTKANVENSSGNARKSEAAIKRDTAWCRAWVDLSTLRSVWSIMHPELKAEADTWNSNGIDDKIRHIGLSCNSLTLVPLLRASWHAISPILSKPFV